jgi:hypothetical protein
MPRSSHFTPFAALMISGRAPLGCAEAAAPSPLAPGPDAAPNNFPAAAAALPAKLAKKNLRLVHFSIAAPRLQIFEF